MSCDCFVAFPHGAVDLSAVYVRGISCSYSPTFLISYYVAVSSNAVLIQRFAVVKTEDDFQK